MKIVCWCTLLMGGIVLFTWPSASDCAPETAFRDDQIRDSDKKPPKIFEQAEAEFDRRNYETASKLYKESLDTLPKEFLLDWEGYAQTMVGICGWHLERHFEAIAALRRSNSLKAFVANYVYLGFIYNRLGSCLAAEENWQKAAEFGPLIPQYQAELAYAESWLGHYDEARKAIDLAHAQDPERGVTTKEQSEFSKFFPLQREKNSLVDTRKSLWMLRDIPDQAEAERKLRESQLLVSLAKGSYEEASRLAGQSKQMSAIINESSDGVRIAWLGKGGPAELAGLQMGDIIVSLGGESIGNAAAVKAALERAPFAAPMPVQVKRDGKLIEKTVIIGIPSNLPALAAAANTVASPPAPAIVSPASEKVSAIPSQPSIELQGVTLKPTAVAPGEQFSIDVSYTATCQATGATKNEVLFSYRIEAGGKKLFESKTEALESANGVPVHITKTLTASEALGTFTIRVRLVLGDATAEREAVLTVERR